jgi:hypothetical protein
MTTRQDQPKSCIFLFIILVAAPFAVGQNQPPVPPPSAAASRSRPLNAPRWTLLVDPVCPVAHFYATSFPNETKELRVMYFPEGPQARLRNSRALTLNVAFNVPLYGSMRDALTVAFERKDDHWEATVPLQAQHAMYAIFSVQDDDTGEVDNRNGEYWDVVFCGPEGTKDPNGVRTQAATYTGAKLPLGMQRRTTYARAIEVIEQSQTHPSLSGLLQADLWKYEAMRDGDNEAAWTKLSAELKQYIGSNVNDRYKPNEAADFISQHQDKFSAEFLEQTLGSLDKKRNDPAHSYMARAAYNRVVRERDPQRRLALGEDFIVKYPDAIEVVFALSDRVATLVRQGDMQGAETALDRYRQASVPIRKITWWSNVHVPFLQLANVYLEKGIKLDQALKLADEALAALKPDPAMLGATYSPPTPKWLEAEIGSIRARAYLALHKPDLALAEAQAAIVTRTDPATYFVLAQALAGAGQKQRALDAYFEAALAPSNDDLKYRGELQRFYVEQKLGSEDQFAAALAKRRAQRFAAADYMPKLMDRPVHLPDTTTLRGERFDPSSLAGKTVVVNFWSPT